jgi:hypothetical protein
MVRVTGPFLSLDARGTLADTMTGSYWRGINYIRVRVVPHNPKTAAQTAVRDVLTDGVSKWRFGMISQANKNFWNTYAKGLGESGFNRFMRSYVTSNYAAGAVVSPQVIPSPN